MIDPRAPAGTWSDAAPGGRYPARAPYDAVSIVGHEQRPRCAVDGICFEDCSFGVRPASCQSTTGGVAVATQTHGLPEISVVLPVLNGMPHLTGQLDALQEQQADVPWELIIADNGSEDGTRDHVLARAADFPVPLRLVDASARRGAAHARNQGILAARGQRLAFCDADDRVGPRWLAAAHGALEHRDVSGGPFRKLTEPHDPSAPYLSYGSYTEGSRGGIVGTANLAVRRDVALAVGGFDESLPRYGGEDLELAIRLNLAGADVGECEEQVVYFRSPESAGLLLKKVFLAGCTEVEVWRRHPDLFRTELRPDRAVCELVLLPRDVAGLIARRDLRKAARLAITRIAHVRARVARRARVVPPALLDRDAVPDEITA
jgi:hypothetical protein